MNPFTLAAGEVRVFSLAFRSTFATALGKRTRTSNAAIELGLRGGAKGYAEAAGSVVMARHTPLRRAQALRALIKRFLGRDARQLEPIVAEAWQSTPISSAAAAFECALTHALLNALQIPMVEWFGGALDKVESDLTLPALGAAQTAQAAKEAWAKGFRRFKVKVAGGGRADLSRVLAAIQGRQSAEIVLDGNQSLTPASALGLTETCLKKGARVLLLEQPLPKNNLKEMARLRALSPVPIAADESVRSPQEALKVLDQDAADVLNVKVAKTGLKGSLEIIALAKAAGKKLMIGCMGGESAAALSASVHLACGTGAFAYVDLDSDCLLEESQPKGAFQRQGPWLRVGNCP